MLQSQLSSLLCEVPANFLLSTSSHQLCVTRGDKSKSMRLGWSPMFYTARYAHARGAMLSAPSSLNGVATPHLHWSGL